jgi:hypothetical protein
MATRITDLFYDISPTEGLTFTIAGPADPHANRSRVRVNVGLSLDADAFIGAARKSP